MVRAARGAGWQVISDEFAHHVLAGAPPLTETLHMAGGEAFAYDINIAWGAPIIDRQLRPPALNGRGLVYEAQARD